MNMTNRLLYSFSSNTINCPSHQAIHGRDQQFTYALGSAWSDVDGRGEQGTMSGNAIRGVSKIKPLGRVFHGASTAKFGEVAPYTGF